MDRQIRRLGAGLLILFLALFVQINYIQVFAAADLANHPGNAKRLLIQEYDVKRGDILARDRQTVLATSRATEGEFRYLRRYPHGKLYAGVTGFYSIVSGRRGLEQSFNEYLSGRADELVPQRLIDDILGRPKRGASVVTTIDARLQEVASQALGGRRGGVVALDPRTGEVLAFAGNPTYDPNALAVHDPQKARQAYTSLKPNQPHNPLLSNASQELYPPGSTFKIVTAAAALESGMTPQTAFPNPPALDLPQTNQDLHNFGNSHCLGGASQVTLRQGLEVSCNVTWAQVGLEVGAEALVEQAERFGFNGDVAFDVQFAEGALPAAADFDQNLPALAKSAIGQQDVRANPLHMALVASAIANDGVQMRPALVREVRDHTGRVVRTFDPTEYGQPISAETAGALTEMMTAVVESGTGTSAQIPGVAVAGKTGTAEQGGEDDPPHVWFVGFAPADDPQVAVAVVVLEGGALGTEATGGTVAAPIAKAVMETAVGGGG